MSCITVNMSSLLPAEGTVVRGLDTADSKPGPRGYQHRYPTPCTFKCSKVIMKTGGEKGKIKHSNKTTNKSAAYAVPPLPLSRSARVSVLHSAVLIHWGWPGFPVYLYTSPRPAEGTVVRGLDTADSKPGPRGYQHSTYMKLQEEIKNHQPHPKASTTNILISGSVGSGKSSFLNSVLSELRREEFNGRVQSLQVVRPGAQTSVTQHTGAETRTETRTKTRAETRIETPAEARSETRAETPDETRATSHISMA
ncbi:UNVERIFIED_CONTAM: hypothetical protein FKN15_053416 [Acipenser sinensis]